MDNSTPAMFAMRIVAANRYVRVSDTQIGKGSARPVCAGGDEVRIESIGRTRSRQESLTQRLQLHKGGRSEILQAPLIATLMAVALSLLVILPALAVDSIKTDGRLDKGKIEEGRGVVGVFSDRLDAQYDWQAFGSDDQLLFDREMRAAVNGTALLPMFKAGAIAYLLDNVTTSADDAETAQPGGSPEHALRWHVVRLEPGRCLQHGADQRAEARCQK